MIKTKDVVEAALMPELLYSVAVQSLNDTDAQIIIDKLKGDVLLYRDVLPNDHAKKTFDRFLDRTATEITDTFFSKETNQWDSVGMFSAFLQLASDLAEAEKLKVTADLAFCIRTLSTLLEDQHGDVWDGMVKAAGKRSRRTLKLLQSKGYFQ